MKPRRITVKAFVQDKNKLSPSLTALFATTQILFGFNFGSIKQMKKFKMAAQCISVITAFVMIAYLAAASLIAPSRIIFFVQYLFTFITLTSAQYTLYEFILDMMNIRRSQNSVTDYYIGIITWVYTSVMFIFKLAIGVTYNLNIVDPEMNKLHNFFALIPILALDTVPIATFLVFYHLYAKMRDLKQDIQSGEADLHEVRATYRDVVNVFDKIRSTNDNLIILGFITDSPKWIFTIWNQLILHKGSQSWLILGCGYAFALHLTIQLCVPAVVAEMAHAQTDAIAVAIHEQLIAETDEKSIVQSERLLRYMAARPLVRRAWRVLPPGLRLPVIMLSTCTTYLIVVVQFSHLYD